MKYLITLLDYHPNIFNIISFNLHKLSRLNHVTSLAFLMTVACLIAPSNGAELVTLDFIRVLDSETYKKSPNKGQFEAYRDVTGGERLYIERQPSHQIPFTGIEMVIVGKIKKYGETPEELKALEREIKRALEPTSKTPAAETYPRGFYYSLTFKMASSEFRRFVRFARNNSKGSFQLRLGSRAIGVLPHLSYYGEEPQQGREFTIATQLDDAREIREVLSPVIGKVLWE